MLAYEEARERLRAHRNGEDGEAVRRRIERLPRRAANVGGLLLGDAPDGEESGWEQLESLSRRRRRALFDAIVPALGSHLERMWQDGVARPYQVGWERRAFRAPRAPAASAPRRFDELASLARRLGDYEVPDAAWLARWAPHLGYQPAEIGLLLAAVIDGGGRDGDDVLDVLYASVEGEEEVGGMGRHVTTALLACDRRDAWEAVVRLLLAAQRQEGLRQVILEAADEARPEGFGLLLDTILEHGLVRFSATARAAGVWLGLEQWAGDERRLQDLLERTAELQRDPEARAQALDGPPAEAYLALAATAWTDAYEALPRAERLLADRDPERRVAAIHLLGQLRVPEAAAPLVVALGDPDLRVAALAFQGVTVHREGPRDSFDRLEAFLRRLDADKVEIEPAVWPGTGGTLERSRVAHELLLWGHAHPPLRLVVHLGALDPYGRSAVLRRIREAGASDPELRGHVLALLGDASPQVRETAVSAARSLTLAEDEAQAVEALLSRKAGDLRRGVVALLLARPDDAVLASADRLLVEGRAPLRLGGLELLRQLVDEDRAVADARRRGREYAEHHPEPSAEETVQLDILLGAGTGAPATLDDGLGLVDPGRLTAPLQPQPHDVQFVSEAALALLRDLDALVHEHRDAELESEGWGGETHRQPLGEIRWWPGMAGARGRPVAPPLPEMWERWNAERPASSRDPDGLELVRALLAPAPATSGRDSHHAQGWQPDRAVRRLVAGGRELPELAYRPVTLGVLGWLAGQESLPGAARFLLDVAETLLAGIPDDELAAHEPEAWYVSRQDARWRLTGWSRGLELARELRHLRPADWTAEDTERLWRLERYATRPEPAKPRRRGEVLTQRPPLPEVIAALLAGAATHADVIEHLVGPRDGWGGFRDLAEVSGRRPRVETHGHEALAGIVEAIRRRVLEVELARGEAPTAASDAAMSLRHTGGLETLVALLSALGKGRLVRGWSYDNVGRETVFSHLIRVTQPGADDHLSAFAEQARASKLTEKRLVELAAFAPQWSRHVEAAVERPGLAGAIWWLHAHTKDDNWSVEAEVRDAWTAEVAERTRLGGHELMDGAVDVAWFRASHHSLGDDGWKLVDAAARFCSSSGGHKRAQLFAAAMLGSLTEDELSERIGVKRHQDTVRALGLLPLPDGDEREAVLLRRYEAIQEFARESRQFGSQRQASEKRAATVGLENLARSAGFEDPTRLGWAMEARGVADLAEGPVRVQVGDVEVALSVDPAGLPEVTVRRGEKPLKSVPAATRKHADVKALRARATELRRRRARMRASLEDAMIRGETFTGVELAELAAHPLLWPMLERLVLVAEDGAGRPREGGRIIARHDSRQLAVGPEETVRIAHPLDLLAAGDWPAWQEDLLRRKLAQPFKQVFRELYVPTRDERESREGSRRYAGHQIQPRQALALLGSRGWVAHREEGVRRTFHAERITASLWVAGGALTAAEVEPPAVELVRFTVAGGWEPVAVGDVPPLVFSEVMRDVDLAVSIAHAGGVDPEASASTIEMRAALVDATCRMLDIGNVRLDEPRVLIDGELGEYSVHLGSATVHRRPGGAVCIVPVSGQQRGRLFLPFTDDDPRTAEVLAKVLMLARDREIKDPSILEQLRS